MSDQQLQTFRWPPGWRSKALPVVGVVVLHVAVFLAILVSSRTVRQFVELADSFVMILLPEPEPLPETTPPERVVRPPAVVNRERQPVKTPDVAAAPAESTAPAAAPKIDWQREMEQSAKNKADATPWQSVVPDVKKRKRAFSWSNSHTRRIEHDKDTGATSLNLNEHCALLYFIIPVCKLGKIKPRGDLFDGMDDPDRPGSVPDAPMPEVLVAD